MSVYLASMLALLPTILLAIIVLVVGLVIASVASSLVRSLMQRTKLDDRIAHMINGGGTQSSESSMQVENLVARLVYWLFIFFTVVAVLQILNVNSVNGPFAPVLSFIPRLLSAAVLLAVAWVVATILRAVVTRLVNASGFLRNASENANVQPKSRITMGQTIGNLVYWLVFLLFLPAILDALQLNGILVPVQSMVNNILSYLPNVLAAAIVFFIGLFVARLVRQIVTNLLASTGLDNIGRRNGMGESANQVSLSAIVGWIAFIFILIPTIITALNALNIPAVSTPASNMLNTILMALPSIFAAFLILAIAYFVGRLLGKFVAELLKAANFNHFFQQMGLYDESAARQAQERVARAAQHTAAETTGQPAPQLQKTATPAPQMQRPTTPAPQMQMPTTPADVVGYMVTVAILLFALLEASQFLGFSALATIVSSFIVATFQVIVGLVIFAIGLFLSALAYRAIREGGMAQANLLAPVARAVIIIFAAALGLRQMGIADSIVNLAFGLMLGAVAVAAAIAFGMGGRDFAHRQLQRWENTINTNPVTPVSSEVKTQTPPEPQRVAPGEFPHNGHTEPPMAPPSILP